MKIASLLAGVAAASLMAAPALAEGPIFQGSRTTNVTNPLYPILGPQFITNTSNNTAIVWAQDQINSGVGSSTALITIDSAGFAGNQGDANASTGNVAFSLTGNVSTDCAYYVGNANRTIAFGEIGVNLTDTNPGAAFEMVGVVPTVDIDTNLAGCNSRNRVTLSKVNLINSSATTQGFDEGQFTDTIKFSANANYAAGAAGTVGTVTGSTNQITLGVDQATDSRTHGAWKSAMRVRLAMVNPGKGLVAGDYAGSVTVNISAF